MAQGKDGQLSRGLILLFFAVLLFSQIFVGQLPARIIAWGRYFSETAHSKESSPVGAGGGATGGGGGGGGGRGGGAD